MKLTQLQEKIYSIQNKSVQAFLLGYVLFKVNDKFFLNYNKARNYRLTLTTNTKEDVVFEGWNVFLSSWRGFFRRVSF